MKNAAGKCIVIIGDEMTVFKYAWCKIKNIAVQGRITDIDCKSDDKLINSHIDLCNHIPSNAIRLRECL